MIVDCFNFEFINNGFRIIITKDEPIHIEDLMLVLEGIAGQYDEENLRVCDCNCDCRNDKNELD